MTIKKHNIIASALLLGFITTSFALASDNNLVQLDLKKSSNNSVDVTLMTSDGYNDNVLVRKKSDNKYVILIPKVQSSGYSTPNLSAVRDLVSNVDVKTVNDTSGGYTKVTLITTKPLDIRTNTRKSVPVTEEQKEYKSLIAQANAVKNTISNSPVQVQKAAPKTEVTVNNVQETPKKIEAKTEVNKVIKEVKNIIPEVKTVESDNEKAQKIQRHERLAELIQEEQLEQVSQPVEVVDSVSENIEQEVPVQKVSLISRIMNSNLPKAIAILMIPFFALIMMINFIKSALNHSNELKKSFVENLSSRPSAVDAVRYNNIANDVKLSWQEKYKLYLSESAVPVSRGENKGNYTFIKTPAEPKEITQKRIDLEKFVEEIPSQSEIEPEIIEVVSENDVIVDEIKLKAFDTNKKSLKMTSRTKSRFKRYETEIPLREQQNVELGSSRLHTNPRRLKDANLDVADVSVSRLRFRPYVMSSVDEYFSILDKEEGKITQSQPVQNQIKSLKKQQTNPITKNREDKKSDYINNLIIKSGYDIDKNKGFYLINDNGQNALVGKINDEMFVLKKFDQAVTKPLQVRRDNGNVFMIKAGGFKSLVEVNENKMGVLIEL